MATIIFPHPQIFFTDCNPDAEAGQLCNIRSHVFIFTLISFHHVRSKHAITTDKNLTEINPENLFTQNSDEDKSRKSFKINNDIMQIQL